MKLIGFQSVLSYNGIIHTTFSCFGEIALSKQTAIVVCLETPIRNWVDKDVLF